MHSSSDPSVQHFLSLLEATSHGQDGEATLIDMPGNEGVADVANLKPLPSLEAGQQRDSARRRTHSAVSGKSLSDEAFRLRAEVCTCLVSG